MRQIIWAILFLLLTIFSLPAWVESRVNAPPTLKIGLVAPFEGLHRPLGYEALFGVKLALQERNQGDGVEGYRVELAALNDFDDPVAAETQARALAADPEVVGVVGHLSSVATLAALPVYREAHLPVVIPWSVAAEREVEPAGVVSVAANLAETGARLVTIGREMGLNSISELVHEQDVSAIAADAEALYLATEGVAAGEILLALRQANISLPVLGQVDVGSPQTVQVAKAAANGLIFASPGPDPQQTPAGASFRQAYQDLAGFSPGPRAVLAYEATQVLLDGIEQSLRINKHRPTRAGLGAIIKNVQRRGLTGEIVFDQQGWRVNAPVWVYQISAETYPGVLFTP